jgi:NAD(P)H-dependent FMN reductase
MESEKKSNTNHESVRVLVFSASLRKDSLNTRLAKLARQIMEKLGGKVDEATMQEFDCPSYNGDTETAGGIPAGAVEFNKRMLTNDALLIASPEFNGSMPGLIKNTIDWVSRFRPQPFNEKQTLLMSASPSMVGGNRGVLSLRIPLEHLGARVFPNMFSLAMAHKAFSPDGKIADAMLAQRFEDNIHSFMNLVEAQIHYPCIKKAWVEFLGEKTDAVTERAE